MMAPDIAREARQAITLIKSFSLELDQYSPESQVLFWLNTYRASWIRDAIIEAVYQGRYKVISVEHILSIWKRRGQPVCHFTSGFEQVIASHLGAPIHLSARTKAPDLYQSIDEFENDVADYTESSYVDPSISVFAVGADESSVLSRMDHSSLSIEAFPVEAVDTLVEVYQANNAARQTRVRVKENLVALKDSQLEPVTNMPFKELNSDRFHFISYSEYVRPESMPIRPFSPTPRRQH